MAATSPAANGNGGMLSPRHLPPMALDMAATSPASNGIGGMLSPRHLPPMALVACCRHVT
jgi:hypothetical protein